MNDEQRTALRGLCPDLNEDQLAQFWIICERAKLDPFRKQIYGYKSGNKLVSIVSVDGMRAIAARSGKYAGQVGPLWCGTDGKWQEAWFSKNVRPAACKVGVLHADFDEPLWSVATSEQHWGNGPMWNKMGPHMLSVRAEVFSLRRAFPNELSGLYTQEEFDAPHPEQPETAEPAAEAPVDMKDRARQALAAAGLGIQTGAEIAEIARFTDEEIDGWLMPALEAAGLELEHLRSDMIKVPDVDKVTVRQDPTMWHVDWKPRIEAWIERNTKTEEAPE